MREIKFRGYDKESQKMYQITDINFSDYSANGVCYGDWKEFSINNLLQYTGLKDKNLVEIYEGDIVNIRGGAFYQGYWQIDKIFEVFYDETGFLLKNKDYKENFWIAEEIEVIGNIYENPELLKNED